MNSSQVGIDWSLKHGRLNFGPSQGDALKFSGFSGSVTIDGKQLFLKDAQLKSSDSSRAEFLFENGVLWIWEFKETSGSLELFATLRNESGKDLRVGEWNILHGLSEQGSAVELGADPGQVRFFGWRPWNMRVERLADQEEDHYSSTLCHLYDPSCGLTALIAFVTIDRMSTKHHLLYSSCSGVSDYRVICEFGTFTLRAGKELRSEMLRISYHADPYQALDSWADEVNARYKPSFEGTQGACMNGGWIDTYTSCQETWPEILLEIADAVEKKLQGFGLKSLSGGSHTFIKYGVPGNWLVFDEIDREGGYPKLLKDVHARGFDFKFWFSPFWFFGEAEGILDENRENLIKDADGKVITKKSGGGGWELARGPYLCKDLTKYFLDGTHPKTKDYLSKVFTAYRELGARSYMLDFLSIVPGAKLHDDSLLPLEACRKILEVIREAAGRDTHIQTAVASAPGFIGCINSARVVRDYGEGRPMHPLPNWRNATYCMHDHHFADAHSFVQNAAAAWFTNRKIYVNDLNQAAIDKPVPLEHARITTTMFGLSGDSPMIVGHDLRVMESDRLRMLKMCLPRTEGVPIPVDLFDQVAPEGCCHILKKPVETAWDSYMLVAVFNTEPEAGPYTTTIDFAKLGLDAAGKYRVFEFWDGEYIGTYKRSFSCTIPSNACRLYRISEAKPHPWLIGTDMHIEQGRAEIESLCWDEQHLIMRGTALRPAGEHGSIYFLIPRHLKLINFARTHTMKEVIDMQTVLWLPLEFTTERKDFELRFEVMNTEFVSRIGWLPYATEKEWLAYVKEHQDPEDTRVVE